MGEEKKSVLKNLCGKFYISRMNVSSLVYL